MNPRQRRGILFLALAAVGAIVVFAVVANYVADVRKNVTPKTSVLVLTRDVPALEPVTADDVRSENVPVKYAPKQAIQELTAVGDRVAGTDLPAGADLEEGMLIEPPQLQPGEREISVLISADTGVAGKIRPGDLVDIEAAFPGDQRSVPRARTIIERARIITIGPPTSGPNKRTFGEGDTATTAAGANAAAAVRGAAGEQFVPVTFALTPRRVQILTYAETYADEVRLALIRPGDNSRVGPDKEYTLPPTTTPASR
jgi:pilus assembly protein CpaB